MRFCRISFYSSSEYFCLNLVFFFSYEYISIRIDFTFQLQYHTFLDFVEILKLNFVNNKKPAFLQYEIIPYHFLC